MSMTNTGLLERYKRTEIETATPAKLLLLLYDAAVQKLDTAAESMKVGKHEQAHQSLLRVQDIITELMVSLNWQIKDAPVAQLYSLYEYLYRGLVKANVKKEVGPIEEAREIMSQLRDTWREAIRHAGASEIGLPVQAPQRRLDLAG